MASAMISSSSRPNSPPSRMRVQARHPDARLAAQRLERALCVMRNVCNTFFESDCINCITK